MSLGWLLRWGYPMIAWTIELASSSDAHCCWVSVILSTGSWCSLLTSERRPPHNLPAYQEQLLPGKNSGRIISVYKKPNPTPTLLQVLNRNCLKDLGQHDRKDPQCLAIPWPYHTLSDLRFHAAGRALVLGPILDSQRPWSNCHKSSRTDFIQLSKSGFLKGKTMT